MAGSESPAAPDEHAFALRDGRHSQAAANICRGTMRMLAQLGFAPIMELTLANNRRADIVALGRKGEIWIIEVKSCLADFRADGKWPDYDAYCDRFYFAVDAEFPCEVLPPDTGLILADRYSAEIIRDSEEVPLAAARRKAVTLRYARAGSRRLHNLLDPGLSSQPD